MKLSILIKNLKRKLDTDGDLHVYCYDGSGCLDTAYIECNIINKDNIIDVEDCPAKRYLEEILTKKENIYLLF